MSGGSVVATVGLAANSILFSVTSDGSGGTLVKGVQSSIVSNGVTETVLSGGTVSGTTVLSGGTLVFWPGATASSVTISSGGQLDLAGQTISGVVAGR